MKSWRIFCCWLTLLLVNGEISFSQTRSSATDNAHFPPERLVQQTLVRDIPNSPDWIEDIPLPDVTSISAVPSTQPPAVSKKQSSPSPIGPSHGERSRLVRENAPPFASYARHAFAQGSLPHSTNGLFAESSHRPIPRHAWLLPAISSPLDTQNHQHFITRLSSGWNLLRHVASDTHPAFSLEGGQTPPIAHRLLLWRYRSLFHPSWTPPNPRPHSYGSIHIILNTHVARNLAYFQEIIPDRFQTYLNRFEPYKQLVQQIFREFGLPEELAYLSLVESGFNPRAYSRARAAGPWQFMKGTGRLYGLRINWYVDERRDPIKSTIAAAHHLRDLYDRFRSWPLALAAYNAGSGKITRAVRRSKSRDFWKIRRTWYIRRETKEYVPRFMAATLIAENPEEYGFSLPSVPSHQFEEVLIRKRVHLKSVAKHTGIPYEELQRLNPELRRNIIPARSEGYYLKVPVGTKSLVERQREAFELWRQPPPPATTWYRVRWGDSLSTVAKRFGMTVRELKRLNHLSHNLIRVGDRLRVRANAVSVDPSATWYTVRYGDSLSTIAQRFGTTVAQLKRLNRLEGHMIHPGDRLRVRAPSAGSTEVKWYRVRPGDSLWSIAKRFSVSVTDLKVLNNLTSSVIHAGRLLLVSQ